MRRLIRRFLPFTSFGGAAWFALRHRRPLWYWGSWAVRAAPRVLTGGADDVWAELRLRRRLRADPDLGDQPIDLRVDDRQAVLRGEVPTGGRAVATALARGQRGIDGVHDELEERTPARN